MINNFIMDPKTAKTDRWLKLFHIKNIVKMYYGKNIVKLICSIVSSLSLVGPVSKYYIACIFLYLYE